MYRSLLLLGLLAPALSAEVITLDDQRPARLQLAGDQLDARRTLRYSGLLRLILSVEGGPGLEVDDAEVQVEPTEWRIERQTQGERVRLGDGRFRWSREVVLDPIAPVKLKIPTLELKHREGRGREWQTARWEGLTIDVVGPNPTATPEIRGQLAIEPGAAAPTSSSSLLLPVLGALAGLAALTVAGVYWWRRPGRPPTAPAHVRAILELERLRLLAYPEEKPGAVHAKAAAIVREYLRERYALNAPRRTSEELLEAARTSEAFPKSAQEPLAALLAECDRVKFTAVAPTREACEAVVTLACHCIVAPGDGGAG